MTFTVTQEPTVNITFEKLDPKKVANSLYKIVKRHLEEQDILSRGLREWAIDSFNWFSKQENPKVDEIIEKIDDLRELLHSPFTQHIMREPILDEDGFYWEKDQLMEYVRAWKNVREGEPPQSPFTKNVIDIERVSEHVFASKMIKWYSKLPPLKVDIPQTLLRPVIPTEKWFTELQGLDKINMYAFSAECALRSLKQLQVRLDEKEKNQAKLHEINVNCRKEIRKTTEMLRTDAATKEQHFKESLVSRDNIHARERKGFKEELNNMKIDVNDLIIENEQTKKEVSDVEQKYRQMTANYNYAMQRVYAAEARACSGGGGGCNLF